MSNDNYFWVCVKKKTKKNNKKYINLHLIQYLHAQINIKYKFYLISSIGRYYLRKKDS